jgi:hypothetical protein
VVIGIAVAAEGAMAAGVAVAAEVAPSQKWHCIHAM